jgi:phosphatidylglycerol:prolipoprotein diacylglycerol transferase
VIFAADALCALRFTFYALRFMELPMYPILFSVGSTLVYSYGVCILLGTVVLFAVVFAQARRAGRPRGEVVPIMLGSLVGSFVGARLSQALLEPEKAETLLNFYGLMQPGVPGNVVGLMIGGFLGGLAVQRSLELPSLGNYYALALAAAQAVWRVGCTLAGCCYGTPTDLPWAIYEEGAYRHPTMVYEGLFNLAILAILWRLRGRLACDNELLYFYFAAYALFRFWLEFIRVYPQVALGLTGAQFLCLASLAGLGIYWWKRGLLPLANERAA